MTRSLLTSIRAAIALLAFWVVNTRAVAATPSQIANHGAETLAQIEQDFHDGGRRYYRDKLGEKQPVFMWGAGVQFTALTAAARWDKEQSLGPMERFAEQLQDYWVVHRGVGGYDVLPMPKQPDRYYDDNEWIVLALVEAYEVSGKRLYLDRAKQTLDFVMTGRDDRLGGGVYWRERRRRTKNTCSNAPAIVALLRVYQHTKSPELLTSAKRLYAWTRENLRDQSDGLYWDNVRPSRRPGGVRLDKRKYSYNTALMIRAHCLFYELDETQEHLDHAKQLADAAATHWIDANTGAVRDSGRFSHLLLESLLEVDRVAKLKTYRPRVIASLDYLHNHLRDQHGRYPNRWDAEPAERHNSRELIDQSSAARAFFETALAIQDN